MANLNAILKNKMGLSAEQAKKSKVLASLWILPTEHEINSLYAIGFKH
ncbi:MAG: hypothetical protein ACLTS6_19290 [Anaerobutyricum sp.]